MLVLAYNPHESLQQSLTIRSGFQSDELKAEGGPPLIGGFVVAQGGFQDKRRGTWPGRERAMIRAPDLEVGKVGSLDPHPADGDVLELPVPHLSLLLRTTRLSRLSPKSDRNHGTLWRSYPFIRTPAELLELVRPR